MVTVLAALAWAAPARAQAPAAASAHDVAVREFAAARTFFEKGDCAGARPHFLASLGAEQSVGARFNLAECAARGGRSDEAWNHFRAAERLAVGRGEGDRAKLAHDAAADLDRRITTVRVSLPPGSGVLFSVDGNPIPETDHWLLASGYALAADVDHTLVVEAPNRPRWERRNVRGAPGTELPPMAVELVAPIAPPPPAVEPPRSSPLRTTSFVVGGTGVASLAAGAVFALLASSATSDAQEACASSARYAYPGSCDPLRRDEVNAANHTARTDAAVATVTMVSGAVLLSASVLMFLLSRP